MKVFLSIANGFLAAPWHAFVLMTMWRWFVTPLGVAEIGLWHAAGISTFVALFIAGLTAYGKDTDEIRLERGIRSWILPLIVITVGFAEHWLMTR